MDKYAPFHISVAATAIHNGEERIWYSEDQDGRLALNLTQKRAHELLVYLDEMQRKGFMVCAWNDLGFDLKWIVYQANDMTLAARVALKSYDPMFQFFNQAGFPVGLAKVAEEKGDGGNRLKSLRLPFITLSLLWIPAAMRCGRFSQDRIRRVAEVYDNENYGGSECLGSE